MKSTFLHEILNEEIYVQQPPIYEVEGQEDKVYRLKKSLHGIKQVPRAWYNIIDTYILKNGFCRSITEPTLYTKVNEHGKILFVFLYVNGMIYVGDFELDDFKAPMKKYCEMTDLGLMKYFLGLEVENLEKGTFIFQNKYAKYLLKFNI